jgi:hypothetical protein
MIKPTEEMIQAQAVAFSARMGELLAVGGAFDMADPKRAGLAAVLAIVERDYEPRRCDEPSWAGHHCTKPRGHDGGHVHRFSGTVWP